MRSPNVGLLALISIHAPPRGATNMDSGWDFTALISIHAPPRGATGTKSASAACVTISIHAPPRGATRLDSVASTDDNPFQFTPLREGRRKRL